MRMPAFALVVFLASGLPSQGQTPGGASPSETNKDVACGSFAKPVEEIGKLRNTYFQGNWHKLQVDTRALLNQCAFNADGDLGIPAGTLDLSANYVFVVIPAANGAGEPAALRYLVRNPDPHPFTNRLPGIGPELLDMKSAAPRPHVYQVLLSPVKGATLATTFVSTEQQNPLDAQIPDFVKAALDPSVLLPLISGVMSPLTASRADTPAPKPPPPAPIVASLARLSLPHERGDVKIQDVIKLPASLNGDGVRALVVNAQTTRRDIATAPALSGPATSLSDVLYAEIVAIAGNLRSKQLSVGGLTCDATNWQGQCWKSAETLLTDLAKSAANCNGECTGERLAVLERYKKVLPAAASVTGSTSIVNTPLTRVTLGAMSGILLTGTVTKPRAKIDGGKIVDDPLPRQINIVAVQIHKGHDASLVKPSGDEQFRGFVGTVITPSFGAAAGFGWAPIRNLSINIGYALMLTRTPKSTEVFGDPPKDKSQPFDPAAGHGAFFAIGYKLK